MWETIIPIAMQILGKNSPGMQKINSAISIAQTLKKAEKELKTDKSV